MTVALLLVAFIVVAGFIAWGVEYTPDDRMPDTKERRYMQIAAERHDRNR